MYTIKVFIQWQELLLLPSCRFWRGVLLYPPWGRPHPREVERDTWGEVLCQRKANENDRGVLSSTYQATIENASILNSTVWLADLLNSVYMLLTFIRWLSVALKPKQQRVVRQLNGSSEGEIKKNCSVSSTVTIRAMSAMEYTVLSALSFGMGSHMLVLCTSIGTSPPFSQHMDFQHLGSVNTTKG